MHSKTAESAEITKRDLMDEIIELKADIQKIKSEVTAKQPSKKFKVAQTATDKNNNLVTRYANSTARAVGKAVKERGGVKTAEMQHILTENGVDASKPTVINIMRRYANEFERFRVHEPKAGIRKSLHLKYSG